MQFKDLRDRFSAHIEEQIKNETHLFEVEVDKDLLWNTYLDSFPPGTNEIFRERREYDCGHCRHFIKTFGAVVIVDGLELKSIWEMPVEDPKYKPVFKAMAALLKDRPINKVFVNRFPTIGTGSNKELLKNGEILTWNHFFVRLPKALIYKNTRSFGDIQGEFLTNKQTFKRALDELTDDSVETVLELIAQKSLYKGAEWKKTLEEFLKLKKEYNKLEGINKDTYCWVNSIKVGPVISKIRNHSIGTLLVNISEGMALDIAVGKYEAIVAPSNYKRPKAIFTKRMIEDAQKKLTELGLIDSLGRRHATLEDISINNILFANKDAASKMLDNVFDELKQEVAVDSKKFGKVEEVGIDTFIKDILPGVRSMELLFENKYTPNLVSLIAPQNKDCKSMLKWNNNFSWAYNGNITDSMKENVKKLGGNVDGVIRFSIQWNDKGDCLDDLDAHCIEPDNTEIYYSRKTHRETTGRLDVDIIHPTGVAVENITWSDPSKMLKGKYTFSVHNYTKRGGKSGFTAELEYAGITHTFYYPQPLRQSEIVQVATLDVSDPTTSTGVKLLKSIDSDRTSKKVWGISTNQFIPITICMFSPNYWDNQKGIGNRHFMFILKGCKNPDRVNGFFNEFLRSEFIPHRKVFEALGSKMGVEPSENQLSGVGFSDTQRNIIILKVTGKITRTLKIKI